MKITKEAKVGLLVVVSLSILYTGFNFLKGKDYFSNDNTYHIMYMQIDGLVKSNPVVINGFNIGRVDEIELQQNNGDSVLVTISVTDNVYLTEGTYALLIDDGLLGGKKISLELGNSDVKIESGSYLTGKKDGGFTEAIAAKATPVIENLDKTLSSLNNILADSTQKGLQNSLFSLNTTIKDIDKLTNETTSLIRKNKPTITKALSKMDSTMASFQKSMKTLEPLMASLNQIADSLNDANLKATIAEATKTMASFHEMADNINQGKGTLGKLMTDDEVYKNLSMAVQRMNLIMYNFDTDPKQYLAPLGQSQKKIMKKRQKNEKVSGHYKEFNN